MKKLMEGQKDRIRAAELPILPSSFLSETLEKETLRITCFRDNFRSRQVNRYDRVNVVLEVPAGRWGIAVFSRKGHPDRALGSEKEKPAQTRGPGTSALRGQGKWSRFLFILPCRFGCHRCCCC